MQLPPGEDEASLFAKNPPLFDHGYVKEAYRVDSYWEVLGVPMEAQSIQRVSYWHSMWSHRRDGMWKGFVQVDLESTQDPVAAQVLAQVRADFGDAR
ncbi:hypothetical protein A9973_09080 [Achromobacter sp. UMC46]|nr:hypothetical protein [Achromobacter sp. UMC46]